MPEIDWGSLFTPKVSLIEMMIRGTVVYLALFFALRVLRRDAGAIEIADLLFVVLVADAAQNAMGSRYESITEGFVLVGTILAWNYILDYLAYRFPAFQRIVRPQPLLLIKDGVMQRRNMQKEMITKEELLAQMREQGVDKIEKVKRSYLESDGRISVVLHEQDQGGTNKSEKRVAS